MVIALSPTALLWWLLADPAHNQPWVIKLEHFVITSNVSIVAAFVGFLVARAALGVAHFRTLLVALGFASMAGIFAVHGLSTPDVLQQGNRAAAVGLVVALYLFATIAQLRDFIRTGLPLQGALGFAYLFLAQAQISQFLGPSGPPRGGNTTGSCSSRSRSRSARSSSSSTAVAASS